MTANPTYNKLRQKVEAALIDNGGMDFDLMTRTEESEVAEFIMSYIWPAIEKIEKEYVRWRMVSDPFFNPSADRLANE